MFSPKNKPSHVKQESINITVSTIQKSQSKSQSITGSDIILKGSAVESSKGIISPRLNPSASSHFFKRVTTDKKSLNDYLTAQSNYRLDQPQQQDTSMDSLL